jgi:quercetin dioxygenase-like cupin family protein
MTETGGYVIAEPRIRHVDRLIEEFQDFKPENEYIQAHVYVSLFEFSQIFDEHNDPGQHTFIVAGEGVATWSIQGYDDLDLDPGMVLYLPAHIPHKANSKGPRYSTSVVIETEESYNRCNVTSEYTILRKNNKEK